MLKQINPTGVMSETLRRALPRGPGFFGLLGAQCFLLTSTYFPQQQSPATPEPESAEATVLPGDWGPELLDGILSSPNGEAADSLRRAAFAAGPAIVPQLEAALKDDRTAEFAAQCLAFVGGEKATQILKNLVGDPRDLNLRRFYYAALGESNSPEATDTLLKVINSADQEQDRTVPQAAILALTVRSDLKLVPRLRKAEARIKDPVIRDDLDNAIAVIETRAQLLASAANKSTGSSIERAVRTYFLPALELPPPPPTSTEPAGRPAPARLAVHIETKNLTFSPDQNRALARVNFEDGSAEAQYDIVLQKRSESWTVVSVWLGPVTEKPAAAGKQDVKKP